MKTYSQKPAEVIRKWYVLDASQTSFGRVSTVAASLLIGKGKPTVTAHVDGGDFVIIVNAEKLIATGTKAQDKTYNDHSGFPGGLRTRNLSEMKPEDVLIRAIRGMLPVNKLRDGRLARLKVYTGSEHNHNAQQPIVYELKKGTK